MTDSLWRKRQEPEALKLALKAYLCREMPAGTVIGDPKWWVPKIANAIKEALAQPEQEPVAWRAPNWGHGDDEWVYRDFDDPVLIADGKPSPNNEALYTSPPQRTWVGLTDDDIWEAYMESPVELDCSTDELYALSRTVEAKLKEKNAY